MEDGLQLEDIQSERPSLGYIDLRPGEVTSLQRTNESCIATPWALSTQASRESLVGVGEPVKDPPVPVVAKDEPVGTQGRRRRRAVALAAAVFLVMGAAIAGGVVGGTSGSQGNAVSGGSQGEAGGEEGVSEAATALPTTTTTTTQPPDGAYFCREAGSTNSSAPFTAAACASLCTAPANRSFVCCDVAAAGVDSCDPQRHGVALAHCLPRPPPACEPAIPPWAECAGGTPAHLSNESVAAQGAGFPLTVRGNSSDGGGVDAGRVLLPASEPGQSLTLQLVGPDCSLRAVARSYDGQPWEGVLPTPLQPDCDKGSGACSLVVHAKDYAGGARRRRGSPDAVALPSFRVDSFAGYPGITEADAAARLMHQATFGPTQREVEEYLGATDKDAVADDANTDKASAWVHRQMAMEPRLMRVHARERMNPRQTTSYPQGPVLGSCDQNSRWQNFTFNFEDRGKNFLLVPDPQLQGWVVRTETGGTARTEVMAWPEMTWSPAEVNRTRVFQLCIAPEYPEARLTFVWILHYDAEGNELGPADSGSVQPCHGRNWPNHKYATNVPIVFRQPDLQTVRMVDADDVDFDPVATITPENGNFIATYLRQDLPCSSNAMTFMGVRHGDQSVFYRWDPRLAMVSNTLRHPHVPSVSGKEKADVCIGAPKTFLNEHTCVRIDSAACSQPTFKDGVEFALDHDTLRKFHAFGNRFVYAVRSLRLEHPHNVPPCANAQLSRWVRQAGACPAPAEAETGAHTAFVLVVRAALTASASQGTEVRDVRLSEHGTCYTEPATVGARVELGGDCWTHSHPNEGNVYDFTGWSLNHPGNYDLIIRLGRSNPITDPAMNRLTEIHFPRSHPIARWTHEKAGNIDFVGVLGTTILFSDLDTSLKTVDLAEAFGVVASRNASAAYACGSRGEVASVPTKGNYFLSFEHTIKAGEDQAFSPWYGAKYQAWQTIVLQDPNQLRQRVSWALAQVFNLNFDTSQTEMPAAFIDIFTANAFGKFGDILREVAMSPAMGAYLSFMGNKKANGRGAFPDENFAREVMQLFTIGLFKLNTDGTMILDNETQAPIDTYTNDDIVDHARVWTGWQRQARRKNLVHVGSTSSSSNNVDPMNLNPTDRDFLPKTALNNGYLGDGYPLCDNLPRQRFLSKGSRYELVGKQSLLGDKYDNETRDIRRHFAPDPSSRLFRALCARDPSTDRCTFPDDVVLDETLPCSNKVECGADTLVNVKMDDRGRVVFYQFIDKPCVRLAFFSDGRQIMHGWARQCAQPGYAGLAGTACCSNGTATPIAAGGDQCLYIAEPMSFTTAERRCAALGGEVCSEYKPTSPGHDDLGAPNWLEACADHMYTWTPNPCRVTVQVFPDGDVGLLEPERQDDGETGSASFVNYRRARGKHSNAFTVRWTRTAAASAEVPHPVANASGHCEHVPGCTRADFRDTAPDDGSWGCMCEVAVDTTAVYTNASVPPPTPAELRGSLFIGSEAPAAFPARAYTRCTTPACMATPGVAVHTLGGSATPLLFDVDTIFELTATKRQPRFFLNRLSTVRVGRNTTYSFRNAPHFLMRVGEHVGHPPGTDGGWHGVLSPFYFRDRSQDRSLRWRVYHESEALVRHLLYHDNTAPFIAIRMIQRLVSSNPSPRYVAAVATAFRTGVYAGRTYSGEYGCMAATVAAVLLDREARASILDHDPGHGKVREPIVKLFHVLRSMDFRLDDPARQLAMPLLQRQIGQNVFSQPSVFGFFDYDYSPEGVVADAELVSPEARLVSAPLTINFLNGMTGLVDRGLAPCDDGFGDGVWDKSCGDRDASDGTLHWMPSNPSDAATAVHEMGVLLTGGRLADDTRSHLVEEYHNALVFAKESLLDGTATQSSTRHGGEAARAIDGNTDQLWGGASCTHTSSETDPWLEVDLGQVKSISGVTVYNRGDCCGSRLDGFDLLVDGRPCAQGVEARSLGGVVRVPCNATGRVIRVQLTGPGRVLTVCELEVDSAAGPAVDENGRFPPEAEKAAVKHLMKNFLLTAEFNTLTRPVKTPEDRVAVPDLPGDDRGFKAVFVTALTGGADTYNMLVPSGNCTVAAEHGREPFDLYGEYAAIRQEELAKKPEQLLQVDVPPGTQPCARFGINEKFAFVHELYEAGDLAFVANAGALVEGLQRQDFTNPMKKKAPPGLYGHNLMQLHAATVDASDQYAHGVVGKMLQKLTSGDLGGEPYRANAFSVTGPTRLFSGSGSPAILADRSSGIVRYRDYTTTKMTAANVTGFPSSTPLAESYLLSLSETLRTTEAIGEKLEDVQLVSDVAFPGGTLGQQFRMAARTLRLAKLPEEQGGLHLERAAVFTSQGGYDTHSSFSDTDARFQELDQNFRALVTELKAQGIWDEVVIIITSDFGRTLTHNSRGTDHAWSGHYFVMGGGVRGKRIFGEYPERLDSSQPNQHHRGRIIPSMPWQGVWNPIAQWWGVEDEQHLSDVLPHRDSFEDKFILQKEQMFTMEA